MYQQLEQEIPKARVNITLDLFTGGETIKKELPLKILCMGDFSGGCGIDSLANRPRVPVTRENLQQVIATLSPKLTIQVDNKLCDADEVLNVSLSFQRLQDFSPEKIVLQVPILSKLLAMRNLLKDLKANILDNHAFRHALEKILKDHVKRQHLQNELAHIAPLEGRYDA